MNDRAPGQDDKDIPERGWDVEPCLKVVKDTERFVTYCALPPDHEGPCDDATHFTGVLREEVKDMIGLPDDLITELEIGLGLVEGSRQYDAAIGAAEITRNYYGKQT